MKPLILLSASVLVSQLACADWYFRGTANNWGSEALTDEGSGQYSTCQSFSSGDNNGGPRFKIDRYADWTESYPSSDFQVEANTSYRIDFDENLKSISISVSECDSQTVDSWYFRGTSNDWSTTEMNFLGDSIYQIEVTFSGEDSNARFKIDHFGDWTESYPSTDYIVTDYNTYDIRFDASSYSIDVTNLTGEDDDDPVVDAGSDFREETIYFLLTARFYDGDPSNNYYNRDRIEPGDPHWRGDFKGLIEKLDYIVDLGFTAVWITPPIENRSGLDYHGYHAYDWNVVDPRLESEDATYQDFIDAAHAKGLKIIQDVVINHSSQYGIRNKVWIDHLPIKYYVPQGSEQGEIVNDPYFGNLGDYKSQYRDDNDNPVAPEWFRERHSSDADGVLPLIDPKTGTSVPLAGYDANRFFGIDANTLDPDWYHLDGFMAGGDWENQESIQNKHLAGDTIDLATENDNVKAYLNDAIKMYLDMGVDAIRLDTAKHIERDELLTYIDEWQTHKPGTFIFGEVLVKGLGFGSELGNDNASATIRPWWYTRTGADPSNPEGDSDLAVLDFPLFSTFRDNVTNGSLGGIGGALSWDWTYADPTELVTFFQNHDVGPDNDFKYRFGGNEAHAALAYNLLWTVRGIPSLYYGEEIMFQAGFAQDIQGNNDTVADTGRAYFGDALDNLSVTQDHALYQHIKRLNQIRGVVPALQKGQMEQVNEWGSGMSFVRNFNNAESLAVVGLTTGNSESITVSGVPNGNYVDAVSGQSISVTSGVITFNVNSYSAGIYVLNGSGKVGESGVYLR